MGTDLVYEPTRHELYVTSARQPVIRVFDAQSGERAPSIDLPGWWGLELEAIPGRVFLTVGGKDGLYAVDAATHAIAPWPVEGRISTPAHIEAGIHPDATCSSPITADRRHRRRHREGHGRVIMATVPAIAFDPGTGLLVATWTDAAPPVRVVAYEVTTDGLSVAARLENPSLGAVGVEPTEHGFIQAGHRVLIVWKATGVKIDRSISSGRFCDNRCP